MSLYSLPMVIFNLGGEMFYVLDQRLKAQHIPAARAQKVLNEIAATLFNEVFIHEVFKPQSLYNKQELYLLFKDIAHASIMKLNDTSMGKLYDLMIMVFKYQLYTARQPREILLITLNHLSALRNMVTSPNVFKQLDSVYYLFMKTYYSMHDAELQRVRYDLLNYFQDIHIKVSIFLRLGVQNNDSTFVHPPVETLPYSCEEPGVIKFLNKDGTIGDINAFPPGGDYKIDREKACLELKCTKGTTLGTSIYEEKSFAQDFSWTSEDNLESQIVKNAKIHDYRTEMNTLINQLVGSNKKNDQNETILLDLFIDDRGRSGRVEEEKIKTVTLCENSVRKSSILESAATQVSVSLENSEGDDNLLYLLENTE